MASSPNKMTIDLTALRHNLDQVKYLVGSGTRIMGIVKSGGYGHGLVRVSQELENNGVSSLGVSYLNEAVELREKGIGIPIVLLCGIKADKEEAREAAEKDLTVVVYDMEVSELLDKEAARKGKRIKAYLKVDTGMGRLGVPYSKVGGFMEKVKGLSGLYIEGIMSHLSSADETDREFTEGQIRKFKKAVDICRSLGVEIPINSLANSAGIMAYRGSHFNMVRPGIMLYGGAPSPDFDPPVSLKPVMSLKGSVLQVRDLPGQTPVSYGRRYYTDGPKRMAVVSAGYGDGIPRSASKKGMALIGGKKVNIAGTICMNMTVCDVTGLDTVGPGDEVVFLGRQGKEVITGDEIAGWAGSISYEIFLSIGKDGNRNYIQ